MKAYYYEVEVHDSTLSISHSWMKRKIKEAFIPDYDICFNEDGYVFENNEPRNKNYKEVDIDEEVIDVLEAYLEIKEDLDSVISDFFENNN